MAKRTTFIGGVTLAGTLMLASCATAPAEVLLAEHDADVVVLQLDMGVGNVDPEEAALDRVDLAVFGDGRLEVQGVDDGQVVDQQQLDLALATLGELLSRPEESSELARRMLSNNDDGGIAVLSALVDAEQVSISLPGYVHFDHGTDSEADKVVEFRESFFEVMDPAFWS